jgi:hypothetical protein
VQKKTAAKEAVLDAAETGNTIFTLPHRTIRFCFSTNEAIILSSVIGLAIKSKISSNISKIFCQLKGLKIPFLL